MTQNSVIMEEESPSVVQADLIKKAEDNNDSFKIDLASRPCSFSDAVNKTSAH